MRTPEEPTQSAPLARVTTCYSRVASNMCSYLHHARQGCRFACRLVLATICIGLIEVPSARGQLRPYPAAMGRASAELVDRLRADPFNYFRFINRPWIARVCEAFADVSDLPMVRLHGDAHVEQFALTKDAWGLDDFDDSARGPAFVDIVRFLGSIDLATRQRGWTRDRDALWDRFLEGYRRGLSDPDYRPPEPDIVRQLRGQALITRAAFLSWGEGLMQPMEEAKWKSVVSGMEKFERFARRERPELAQGYFTVKRAGWLRMGVGSAVTTKILIQVQGPTTDAEDDELLEAKEVTNLEGIRCLEGPTTPPALRIVDGTRQLGRLKHNILAVGPTLLISAAADRGDQWLDWWILSWEPSYREVRLSDLRSVKDLADIVYDSGVQLGAGESQDNSARKQTLSSVVKLEGRLRKETSTIIEELLAGWRELRGPSLGQPSSHR
jgi:uncharacterized protein DUF2252